MPKRHADAVQHSSKEPNWRTPPSLFAQLDQEFAFIIDAAATKDVTLCQRYFGPDVADPVLRDALTVDWDFWRNRWYDTAGPGYAIFVNPPYSRELKLPIGPWIEKCWLESQKGAVIVGVIPYSPQTEWWRKWVEGHEPLDGTLATFHAAREVRKIPHRVSFLRPDGTEADNAGGNTAIVVWKPKSGLVAPWVPWSSYWDYL